MVAKTCDRRQVPCYQGRVRVTRLGLLAAMFAAVLLGELSVVALHAGEAACGDDCEDEGDGDECPPFCGDCAGCVGCWKPIGIVSHAVLTFAATGRAAQFLDAQRAPPSAEPRDILVVPRPS